MNSAAGCKIFCLFNLSILLIVLNFTHLYVCTGFLFPLGSVLEGGEGGAIPRKSPFVKQDFYI